MMKAIIKIDRFGYFTFKLKLKKQNKIKDLNVIGN